MGALKRKNLGSMESVQTGALPEQMISLERAGQVHLLALSQLQPAPAEWNFYRPLPEGKLLELLASIRDKGLLHPVVVWKRNADYMILSGHNRVEAFRRLYADGACAEFASVPCVVLDRLTEESAREIIVDSNWVQRALSPRERVLSITAKYAGLGRKKRATAEEEKGRGYDVIAAQYGLSGRQVARYVQLGNLCGAMLDKLDTGELSFRGACFYAKYPTEVQEAVLERLAPLPDGKQLQGIGGGLTMEALLEHLQTKEEPPVSVTFTVPQSKRAALEALVYEWMKKEM